MSTSYRRRKAKQFVEYNLRVPPWLYEIFRRHAFIREVALSHLFNDILRTWAFLMTDPNDPQFSSEYTGYEAPTLPEERYPGYLDALGFDLTDEPQKLAGRDARTTDPLPPREQQWNV